MAKAVAASVMLVVDADREAGMEAGDQTSLPSCSLASGLNGWCASIEVSLPVLALLKAREMVAPDHLVKVVSHGFKRSTRDSHGINVRLYSAVA